MRATRSYLILSTPRSGSTLLGRGLASTNLAGFPQEYFQPRGNFWSKHWSAADPSAFVDRLLAERATPNGVFGAKISWRQLAEFERACRSMPRFAQTPLPDLLAALFPDLRYVRITRRDKLRQAISFLKAYQTGVWGSKPKHANAPTKPPAFDYPALTKILRMLDDQEAALDDFFARSPLPPFTVVYEDFAAAYRETITATLAHLDIPTPPDLVVPEPRTARLADDLTEDWVERYHQLAREQAAPDQPLVPRS